ncbi:MAG TPA: hypothetical protein VFK04_05250 [Gemmatimonadaceae bacterium]|nr:hypothetical protein [Gemmatimonadaceae bacterium]
MNSPCGRSRGRRATHHPIIVLAPAMVTAAMLAGCRAPARIDPRSVIAASMAYTPPPPDTFESLAAGNNTTCVTTAAGAGYCWGDIGPRHGEPYWLLDDNARDARVASLVPWSERLCALSMDGGVWCGSGAARFWGDMRRLMIFTPDGCAPGSCARSSSSRVDFPGRAARAVTMGADHACALALNGAAFCWGRNTMGQLGNGRWAADSTGSAGPIFRTPTPVVGELRFAQISAGEDMTCGVTLRDGAVYCWGYGQSGQIGDSSVMNPCTGRLPFANMPCSSPVPSRVLPESLPGTTSRPHDVRFVRVDAGMRLACGVSSDGGAWCWGNNYRCALGRCRTTNSPRAHRIQVPGRVVDVGAGYWHACALTADGRVFCWGDNNRGQLGSPVTANAGPDGLPPDYRDTTDAATRTAAWRSDPCFLGGRCSPAAVEVGPGRHWTALAVGSNHACAFAEDDGSVYCWGGKESAAVEPGARLVLCENRSAHWKDVECQPTPQRVPGLPRLIARHRSGAAVPGSVPRRSRDSTRVLVSRRELRVIFPRDTARAWGWSASRANDYRPWYSWSIGVSGIDGPGNIELRVDRADSSARDFPSLESLVAAGLAQLCEPGMVRYCTDSRVAAHVDSGRVTLVMRDSARIADLFGLRPGWVWPRRHAPEAQDDFTPDSVRVEYVDPQIPVPDSALLADAARRRRAYEERARWIRRYIDGGTRSDGALWLVVGESTFVRVNEMRCHFDVCGGGGSVASDSGWSVADTSIAQLRALSPRDPLRTYYRSHPTGYLIGRRPGRTTLHVRGLHGAADTMPSHTPVEHALSLDVVVTPRIGRIEFEPHADTISVGERLELSVRVVDRSGKVIENAPVPIVAVDGKERQRYDRGSPTIIYFYGTPGRRMLVATLGGRADTSYVEVVKRSDCRRGGQAGRTGECRDREE